MLDIGEQGGRFPLRPVAAPPPCALVAPSLPARPARPTLPARPAANPAIPVVHSLADCFGVGRCSFIGHVRVTTVLCSSCEWACPGCEQRASSAAALVCHCRQRPSRSLVLQREVKLLVQDSTAEVRERGLQSCRCRDTNTSCRHA